MLSPTIEDVQSPAAVEGMDRAELIALVRTHEAKLSQWELRVRVCEEKEQLWKNLLQDMGSVLALTFVKSHQAINACAEEAAQIAEKMAAFGRHVEEM